MWDLIVSVPDHCLSFYFEYNINIMRQSSCLVFVPITVNKFPSLIARW